LAATANNEHAGSYDKYRGADKSLARPRRKQATFPAFYGTWRFITTFTRVHHLSLPKPNQFIPLPHHTFDRRSLFPSWSGYGLICTPVQMVQYCMTGILQNMWNILLFMHKGAWHILPPTCNNDAICGGFQKCFKETCL